MFFSQRDSFNVEGSIEDEFFTLKGFRDHLNEYGMLVLQGVGFCTYEVKEKNEKRGYHIIIINNIPFGLVGICSDDTKKMPKIDDKLKFIKIVKFNPNILASSIFQQPYAQIGSTMEYLEASLAVDGKLYEYDDEDKLIFSKQGAASIDMFANYIVTKEGILSIYIQKQSLRNASKQQAMEDKLQKSINKINIEK